MSHHNTSVSLRHMLDHAVEAMDMVKGKTRADLDKDRKLNLALVRLLEIIGEAATRIPKEDQTRYSDISWSEIVSLRNRLVHGYDKRLLTTAAKLVCLKILSDDLGNFQIILVGGQDL